MFVLLFSVYAQEVPANLPMPLTPDEAKLLQSTLAKAIATQAVKDAEIKMKAAKEEMVKAGKEYQAAIEQSAIEIEPRVEPVLAKTHKLQQDMLAKRGGKQVQPLQGKAGMVKAPSGSPPVTVARPPVAAQPRQVAYQSGSKPSDFLDSWSTLAVIICLGVIAVLIFRKR
jgi:hypothetical protein